MTPNQIEQLQGQGYFTSHFGYRWFAHTPANGTIGSLLDGEDTEGDAWALCEEHFIATQGER